MHLNVGDIKNIESEAGVVATLIHNPEFSFYSENLLPNHFSDKQNSYVYLAICNLAQQGINTIDAYNIINVLNSAESTRRYAEGLTIEALHDLIEISDVLARRTVEEYKLLVSNVLNAALRRDVLQRLKECEALCFQQSESELEQKIYAALDDVMLEFSTANEVPPYSEIVDACWEEIKQRQGTGFAGLQFKFPTLNQYATIERGELFVFAAEAKQGKSMMLLNCAVDLLKQGQAVLYLDSELNTRLFTARMISHLTGIEFKRVTSGGYGPEEEERINAAIAWLKEQRFTHVYIPMFDMQTIYTAVKKVRESGKLRQRSTTRHLHTSFRVA